MKLFFCTVRLPTLLIIKYTRKIIWKIKSKNTRYVTNFVFEKSKVYPHVRTNNETIDELIISKKSISRFGDGEYAICMYESIPFQEKNISLTIRLHQILNNKNDKCLIAVLDPKKTSTYNYYWLQFWYENIEAICLMIKNKENLYNSTVSRELDNLNVQSLKSIWTNRNIIFVTGKGSRFDNNHEIFQNIQSQFSVFGLAINAWNEYEKLFKEVVIACRNTENPLVICSLGPTATVLSYDLSLLDIQSLDLGHITNSFDFIFNDKKIPEALPIANN
jgi:hypothetical protein